MNSLNFLFIITLQKLKKKIVIGTLILKITNCIIYTISTKFYALHSKRKTIDIKISIGRPSLISNIYKSTYPVFNANNKNFFFDNLSQQFEKSPIIKK